MLEPWGLTGKVDTVPYVRYVLLGMTPPIGASFCPVPFAYRSRFDKRFIDLMFDFHDPLFVKLRTALEYVNSNKVCCCHPVDGWLRGAADAQCARSITETMWCCDALRGCK